MSDLKTRLRDLRAGLLSDLEALVRIPSVSANPERRGEVEKSAQKTAELLAAEGVAAEIVRTRDGAPPAVIGERKGPDGAPVVLRLYGRGAAAAAPAPRRPPAPRRRPGPHMTTPPGA